jgi:DNA-binding XRE family transcriptional regulator
MEKQNVQIIRDQSGAPVAAVVPWNEYQRLTTDQGEDARLVALATPHRGEEAFPAEVAQRLIAGGIPVKVFREWRGLTQADLARKAGLVTQYISQLERGTRALGKTAAKKLSPVLGVSVAALMDDEYTGISLGNAHR